MGGRYRHILCGLFYTAFLLAVPGRIQAQAPVVYGAADHNSILIGEPVTLTLKTKIPLGNPAATAVVLVPDSIAHFDIIGLDKQDAGTEEGSVKSFTQHLQLTSFDSGRWVIPAIAVQLRKADGSVTEKLQTDSFAVTVNYSPADSTGQLRDIKPIQDVELTDYTWLYITAAALLGLVLLFFIWRYFRKRRKAPGSSAASSLSAYEEAMQALAALKQYDLTAENDIRAWHTGLADIFRHYLGRKWQKNLTSSTTGDLLLRAKEWLPDPAGLSELATVLRCSDAVKFAKYLPPVYESEDSFQKIKALITHLEQSLNKKPD